LDRPLVEIGIHIAETTIETFSELPPGHPLFDRYGLIQSSELEEYAELVEKAKGRDAQHSLTNPDYDRLIALALAYVEPQHRLSQVDEKLEQRVLRARESFRRYLPGNYSDDIEFYEPDRVMMAAPIRDNLLFGRITFGVANSERKVSDVLRKALDELGLTDTVYRLGLDYDVGPGGKLLFATQRTAVSIARCLIRRPDILIVDGGLSDYSSAEAADLIAKLRTEMAGRTLIMVLADETMAEEFDMTIKFDGARAVDLGRPRHGDHLSPPPQEGDTDAVQRVEGSEPAKPAERQQV
jgi:putative ABC transport system ATP-binding protein